MARRSTPSSGEQLNLKSGEARRLAAELSRMTGESMTEAVVVSLRERLDREARRRGREGLAEDLLAMGRALRARMPEPPVAHGDLLYGEDGLPR